MNAFLQYVDRLVAWRNHDLDSQPEDAISKIAGYMTQFGPDKVTMMIGLWDNLYSPDFPKEQMTAIPAKVLKTMLQSTDQGGITNQWISPSFLMSQEHWNVLESTWGTKPTTP